MAKIQDYNAGREDGLVLALKIVQSDGIDALREEIKYRGITGFHTTLAKKDLEKATDKIKAMTVDTVMILSVATLHDEFGFGEKRYKQFLDRANKKADCLMGDMVSWKDYIDTIKEEPGIEMILRENGKV